jgi:translation initiation factor 3 subunit A
MQVAQLEKEKVQMNERLRIISKRIDHIERAYRKAERPLLSQDYVAQQALDLETHKTVQASVITQARAAHEADMETKGRLARMLGDYMQWRGVVVENKGEMFRKKEDVARKKIESEKAKRREAVLKEWEEEREKEEKEAEERRKDEEEARREEEGAHPCLFLHAYFS